MGVGVFTDDLIKALGLTRTQLSLAYMLGTITSSFVLPYAGRLIDRIGTRIMVVISSLGLGASLLLLSFSDRLAHITGQRSFYLSIIVIFVCFMFVRFFGQGCLTVTSRVTLGKWFNHRRGRAVAISGIFVSFGFSIAPRVFNWLIVSYGWQMTCHILAISVGCGMGLIGWIFYRDNPEECGLVMDGIDDESWLAAQAAKITETCKDFTRSEALRTIAFWAFSLAMATQALVVTALAFHITSISEAVGLTREQAYEPFLPMSFVSAAVLIIGSIMSDRTKLKYLLFVMIVGQLMGTTSMLIFGSSIGRLLFIIGYGTAGGIFGTLVTVVFPRFFGREHLGAISGVNMSIMVFASAIGPWLFAKGHELTGDYSKVIMICE